jgi:hypothetical protein
VTGAESASAFGQPATRALWVPAAARRLTLAVFAPYASAGLEACLFWYGPRDAAGAGRVAAVVVPTQRNHWGAFHIDGAAMTAVARATARYGWRNLAQLHGHPGTMVAHSPEDDARAVSRRALSLVLPRYGRGPGWPTGLGVHAFDAGSWRLLTDQQAAARLQLLLGERDVALVDLR